MSRGRQRLGRARPADLPKRRSRENAASVPETRSWVVPAKIYAFSAVLALAAAALIGEGPFLNAGPIRHLTNQPEMLVVVCMLTAVAVWQPVICTTAATATTSFSRRYGSSSAWSFCLPLVHPRAVLAEAFVFLFLTRKASSESRSIPAPRRSHHSSHDHRLPGNSGDAQSCQPSVGRVGCRCMLPCSDSNAHHKDCDDAERADRPALGTSQFTTEAMLMAASICLSFVVLDVAWFSLWSTLPLLLVVCSSSLRIGATRSFRCVSDRCNGSTTSAAFSVRRALNLR